MPKRQFDDVKAKAVSIVEGVRALPEQPRIEPVPKVERPERSLAGAVEVTREQAGRQVARAGYRWLGDDETSHPGWYITKVTVARPSQARGLGFALVKELIEHHLATNPGEPLYLARLATPGRVFEGGFGFKPVKGESRYQLAKGYTIFKADPPDPGWEPKRPRNDNVAAVPADDVQTRG